MIDYEKELNKEQFAVVQNGDGPCLVLAGAGSGKTRTITYRVAYLLEQGTEPEQILLVTFTNKAARQMTSRVLALTGATKPLPWSGTFHHIAYRILRKYAPLLGYQNNFTILDSEDSRDVLKLCLKYEGIDKTQRRFPSVNIVQSIISYARNAERTVESVLDERYPQWQEHADVFSRIADEYRKRKFEANAMDFDDLLVNLYLLFIKNVKVKNTYAEQFKYILVDEYQDTNKIQASIIRELASVHKNVLVVGDDAQSIYSFRAADIEHILNFEKEYKGAQIFKLQQNYRSTPDILDVANVVIAENADQYEKKLVTDQSTFTKPEVHAFVDGFEEASFIAERILELESEGIPLQEMAVLFRATHHSQALEVELTKRGIAYDYRGGLRFFERAHIKDVLAYLRICANKEDVIAWSRILNMQAGIGPATAQNIIELVRSGKEMEEVRKMLGARAQMGFNDFVLIYEKMKSADATPGGLINSILDSKYVEYIKLEYENYEERFADIEQLGIFADKQPDLSHFLAEASMQESFAAEESKSAHNENNRVVLSTIHQAKGLEWEAVFVMHLVAGQFPHDRAFKEKRGLEEERRLFYVAITRARKYLHFTYPLTTSYSSVLLQQSMFIEDLRADLVARYGSVGSSGSGTVFSDPGEDVEDIVYVSEDEPFPSAPQKRSFLKDIDELGF